MKKALCMLLVLVLALGMSTAAFAAYTVNDSEATGEGFSILWDDRDDQTKRDEIDLGGNIEPDTAFWFFPVASSRVGTPATIANPVSFTVTATGTDQAKLDSAVIAAGVFPWRALKDVKLRTRVIKGQPAIRDIQFLEKNWNGANNAAGIRLRTVQRLKNTSDDGVDFEVTVFPTVDGDTWNYNDKGMVISGTVVNDFVDIDSNTGYVDLYNHIVAVAEEAVKDIDYDLGPKESDHTVIVHGRAANGASYWGYSTTEATAAQEKIMSDHDIDVVYNLDYIGLDRVAKHVTLDVDPATYVYDADLNPLGRGNSELPLSKVYYVSYHEIVAEKEPEPEPEFPEPALELPEPSPGTGGFGAPAGPFDNPSTGR